ncbi:MAG TPA: glycosyl transferase [Bacillota bacterium]|nr:glycosyl transferase [Bacillota bacterium]
MTSMTSRQATLSAVAVLQKLFSGIIMEHWICDALFVDAGFERVIGVAGLPFTAPATLELFKEQKVAAFFNELLNNGESLLVLNQVPVKVFSTGSNTPEVTLPEAISTKLTELLGTVNCWGGELNDRGEHIIDLKAPAPGPHYFVNLLLGNRIGFPYALQTTPKSVVDRLGKGSFRSHAGTQVLATRWDMRQEENGFPANRQFYLVEKGAKIFYSADPNDPNIEKATCVHSQNHTVITYRTRCGLEVQRTIFLLPQEEGRPLATEVQRIRIKNLSQSSRQLRLVYTGMFGSTVPGAFQEDVLYSNIILQAKIMQEENGDIKALGVDYYPEHDRDDLRFHSTVIHQGGGVQWPREFVTNYNEFVGNGTLENPEGIYRLSNKLYRKGPGFFAIAATLELGIGQEGLVDNFTGLVSRKANPKYDLENFEKEVNALLQKYAEPAELSRTLEQVQSFYRRYQQFLQLKTADDTFDAYCNYNLPFQVLYQTFVSRSFCQTQKGYREIGFREIQDIFASMYYFVGIGMQGFVKSLLKEWCSQVYEFGYANHNFFWVGKEPGKWSDDALWFIQALARYVHLTGDIGVLDEECVIAGTEPVCSRPVYETVKAILRYSGEISIGKHGMPLLDSADWNDCLKLDTDFINGIEKESLYRKQVAGGGTFGEPFESEYSESVMNAFLLKVALDATVELAEMKNDGALRTKLENLAGKLYHNLQEYAWKENFFARVLFNRFKNNEYNFLGAKGDGFSADPDLDGTYFLNSFNWSILSDTATESQIETMLEVIEQVLKTPFGLKLVTPADLSKVSKNTATGHYFPGDRENGAVFKHASMMAVSAMLKAAKQVKDIELAAKLAKLAYWMIDLTIPANTIKNPYLICGNPRFCTQYNNSETGENIGPMLSGTSTWLTLSLMAACGLEFGSAGIKVDPILRPEQKRLEYRIRIQDTVYRFDIVKPEGFYRVADGKVRIKLDGIEQSGNIIPLLNDGREHRVEVFLGE